MRHAGEGQPSITKRERAIIRAGAGGQTQPSIITLRHAPAGAAATYAGPRPLGDVKGTIEWQGIMDVAGLRYNTQMRNIRGKNWETADSPRDFRSTKHISHPDDAKRIIYSEWKPGNIKSGVNMEKAKNAYRLITQLEKEKNRGSKKSHGQLLQPQLDAAKNNYRKMLRTETEASHPLMPQQLSWDMMFPEISERKASSLSGASRCDMCSRLKSDCGKLFHQGLYNLCSECCRNSSQKSALQGALSLYSPQARNSVENTTRWQFLFGQPQPPQ